MNQRRKALNTQILPAPCRRKRMAVDLDYAGSGSIMSSQDTLRGEVE
jgi:hypothetical protein